MPIKIMTPEDFKKANGGEVIRTYIHFDMPPKQLQMWRDSAAKRLRTGEQKSDSADVKDEKAKAR